MRPLKVIFSFLILFVLFSCRGEDDILAEMKSGAITRAEFHTWLRARNLAPSDVADNHAATEKYLKQMAIEMLAVRAAVSEGFDETPFYSMIRKSMLANYLSSYYKSSIKKKIEFNEKAVELKIIKLHLPMNSGDPISGEVRKDKLALASYIIQQHREGVGFDELIKKYSEGDVPERGRYSRVYPVVLLEKAIFEKIKDVKTGGWISGPVLLSDSIVIICLERWFELNRANSEKLIADKEVYNEFMDYLSEGYIEYIRAEKGAELDIVSNIERARFRRRNELLFSINGETFTSGDLDDLMDLFLFLSPFEEGTNAASPGDKAVALNIFNEHVLASIAGREGVSSEKNFVNQWRSIENSTLAGAYKYSIFTGKTSGKSRVLAGRGPDASVEIAGKGGFVAPPAERKKTTGEYFQREITSVKDRWEKELLQSDSFTIFKDRFN